MLHIQIWFAPLRARAIENQIFVIGVNVNDTERGHSYAFCPEDGQVVFNSSSDNPIKDFYIFTIDLKSVQQAKQFTNNLQEAILLKESRF